MLTHFAGWVVHCRLGAPVLPSGAMTTLEHIPPTQTETHHPVTVTEPHTTQATYSRYARISLVAMTGVLLIAALFRVYHITLQSIWFDEAFAWNIIIQEDMFPRIAADTHPPLYYYLLRAWVAVAGDSALALRYLSALISMGTVAFVYQTARYLAHSRRDVWLSVPVLAALLLALSDAEIFLAQETRNYSLYTFFATLSMWIYLLWLRRRERNQRYILPMLAWSGSVAALMYTHYQGAFIPFVQGLHVLLFLRGRQRIEGIAALALSGLLFLPWFLGVTIPQAQNAIDNSLPFAIPSNWETLLHLRDNYLGAMWALVLLLAGVGVWALSRPLSRITLGRAFLVVMWFAVPFGVLFFGNYFAALLTERKLLIVAPAIALLVAFGLGQLNQNARGLLVAALLLYGATEVDYYRVKEPWDQISAEILPYIQNDHLVTMEIGVGQYPLKYYWSHLLPEDVRVVTFPFLGDFTMAPTTDWFTYYNGYLPEAINEIQTANGDSVSTAWMVFWSQETAALERLEQAGYQRTWTIPYTHLGNPIDIYRYDAISGDDARAFASGMVLEAAEFDAESLRVDLWWSTDTTLDREYIVSAFLLDADGQLVAQQDKPPGTLTWSSDALYYDPHFMEITTLDTTLPPGDYTVGVRVYAFEADGSITPFPPEDMPDDALMLGTLTID